MILPTVTFMTTDSLRAVPRTTVKLVWLWGNSLANHLARDLEGSAFRDFHRSGLWDGACLW